VAERVSSDGVRYFWFDVENATCFSSGVRVDGAMENDVGNQRQ